MRDLKFKYKNKSKRNLWVHPSLFNRKQYSSSNILNDFGGDFGDEVLKILYGCECKFQNFNQCSYS